MNSRKVHDEPNPFKGLMNNKLFIYIMFFTIGVQALIVEVGSKAFKVVGLSWDQWLICLVRLRSHCFCAVVMRCNRPLVLCRSWLDPS